MDLQQYKAVRTSTGSFIFYITCFLIVYGSMYPFEFSSTVSDELVQEFFDSWRVLTSRGDILGNISLFVPFGYFGYLYLSSECSLYRRLSQLCVIWLVVAVGSQLIQFYIPARSPSLFDLYASGLGTVIGIASALMVGTRRVIDLKARTSFEQVALVLLGLWLSVRLLPFVPTIDWQSYKDSLKPLLLTPHLLWSELLLLSVSWLTAGWMGKRVLGDHWRSAYLPISIVVVTGLEVVIINNTISVTDICAGAMAVLLWFGVSRRSEKPSLVLPWLLLVSFAVDVLFPFEAGYELSTFHWLPFSGFLDGSMLINAGALCRKLFVFGAFVWLLNETKALSWAKVITAAFVILVIEVVQLWSLAGTSELTDPLLVLLIGYGALQLLRQEASAKKIPGAEKSSMTSGLLLKEDQLISEGIEHHRQDEMNEDNFSNQASDSDRVVAAGMKILQENGVICSSPEPGSPSHPGLREAYTADLNDRTPSTRYRKKALAMAGLAYLSIMLIMFIVLRLPGIPYNIRELFLYGGNGIDLFFFSAGILAFGYLSAWMGDMLANSTKPAWVAPLTAIAASFVIYLLFLLSVTRESIMDIAGSSVVVHRVGVRGVLGQPGIDWVVLLGAENLRMVTDLFEPIVRFGALIGPVIIFLAVFFAIQFKLMKTSKDPLTSGTSQAVKHLLMYALFVLPWLYFCKVIAFDWSSTDNLNELIARDGSFGWGGGGYLYALVGLMTLSAGLVAWSSRYTKRYGLMVVVLVLISPIGWWLLNEGLSGSVNKYGQVFSGVDFLLGPDRSHHLSELELFGRWTFVCFGMIGSLAYGAMLYLTWIRDDSQLQSAQTTETLIHSNSRKNTAVVELKVHFHPHQIDFVSALSAQLNGTLSSTINEIIDCLDLDMGRSSAVESFVNTQVNKDASVKLADSMLVSQQIDLSKRSVEIIDLLCMDKGISRSRAVRKLVDSFLMVSTLSLDSEF